MRKITQEVGVKAKGLGMEVVDVRIMRADLPQTNSEAIFRRMQTEREREAKEFRAKGAQDAQGIRSRADKERTIILAESQKKAQILRGEGDAQATQIFAAAFNRDPEFFSFYRTMQAYKNSINKDDTSVVLSPDSEFLKYFDKGAR
jgi:modulator of FtsH protease HflC